MVCACMFISNQEANALKKIFSWIVVLPIAIIVVLFSVSNRDSFGFTLWPLPFVVELPVFIVVLLSALLGVIWGGLVAWLSAGKSRRQARINARQLESEQRENKRLSSRITALEMERDQLQGQLQSLQKTGQITTGKNKTSLPATVDAA